MKASFTLPNGTLVQLDGDPNDVRAMLNHLGSDSASKGTRAMQPAARSAVNDQPDEATISEIDVVNWIKNQTELPWIDQVLDSRDVTRRVLLPLYALHHMGSRAGATSGFVSRVLAQLGVRISVPNVSTELAGRAKKFVLASSVRKKGAAVFYTISRAGINYMDGQHG